MTNFGYGCRGSLGSSQWIAAASSRDIIATRIQCSLVGFGVVCWESKRTRQKRESVFKREREREREREVEKSTTNLDLVRDGQIKRKTRKHYNRWNEQGLTPIALLRQDQALFTKLFAPRKIEASPTVTFMLA